MVFSERVDGYKFYYEIVSQLCGLMVVQDQRGVHVYCITANHLHT